MRISGGQALGEEAAGVVRQAVSLARVRGHAQVTPLHIASAMLSASTACTLRAACVRSQSHLLQHNALDLCLGLALDGLAEARRATAASRRCGDHVELAPSNASVAALKRAQAQCRRGAVGGDKVELKQLIVSILDDPSVDRVMRAAGFSSSQVRDTVLSLDVPTLPDRVSQKIRAGGQPSLQTVPELYLPVVADVPDGSECQANKAKSGARWPALFGGTEVVPTTASLPPWLRRYKDTTYCGISPHADATCGRPKFTELTAQNLKILCDELERSVPWHGNIIPGICSTVLRCRSGVTRRRTGDKSSSSSSSTTTWLLFRGRDGGGQTAVARELARLVFGSDADFTALQGNPNNPARSGKRQPSPENDGGIGARLFEAILENPHRVILIDGVDRLDRDSEICIKDAIAGGTMVGGCNGDVVGLEDAIVVLSSAALDSASSPRVKRNREEGDATEMEVRSRRLNWDLNVCAMCGEEEDDGLADAERILNDVDGVFLFN
ncbi:uncharacterized protein [Aegilops tauschii subsp. strangulata]|uniref:uncharacterized protein n=1 Tax=Aegilops tauschii subsp. strangulata TaxID=200361 RepID=UPI001ABBF72D|nr:protein SMAX1-LIKE 3-like [Aegilops tauschii subsp. strangulata]